MHSKWFLLHVIVGFFLLRSEIKVDSHSDCPWQLVLSLHTVLVRLSRLLESLGRYLTCQCLSLTPRASTFISLEGGLGLRDLRGDFRAQPLVGSGPQAFEVKL